MFSSILEGPEKIVGQQEVKGAKAVRTTYVWLSRHSGYSAREAHMGDFFKTKTEDRWPKIETIFDRPVKTFRA